MSFDTDEAKLLKEETGIEFRRKPRATHALGAESSVGSVRATSNTIVKCKTIVKCILMNGKKDGSYAFMHSCTVLSHLSKPDSHRMHLQEGVTPSYPSYERRCPTRPG